MNKTTTVNRLALFLSWLVGLILVLMPFHAFLTVWLASSMGHYTALRLWKELLLVVLMFGVSYILIKDKPLRIRFFANRLVWLAVLYCLGSLIWGIAAYKLHKVTPKALGYGLIVNLRFLVFFLATWVVATKSQWLEKSWSKLLLIPAGGVVIVGLVQRALPYDALRHFGYNSNTIFPYETINHNVHYPRIMSTLRGANPLGAYLVIVLSALSALTLKAKKYRLKWAGFGLLALVTLVLSYSRGAWVGLVVAVAFLAWSGLKTGRAKRYVEISLAAALIIGGVLLLTLRNNPTFENVIFHTQNNSSAKVSSNAGHASALKNGLDEVVRQPLGEGVGTAGPASIYNNNKGRIAENYYVQIAQEVGWLGLVIFLAINYLVAKELWVRRGNTLALALLASFIGLIFVNMFSHAWTDDTLAYIWWGFAGIALAL